MDRRTEKCTGNFSTREDLEEAIREAVKEGLTYAQAGDATGVSFATVRRIISGKEEPAIKYADEREWAAGADLRNKLNSLWRVTHE